MKKLLFLLTVLIGAVLPSHAQLIINEIMQSNIDCIMDDINEFPDSWVELYNAGDEAVMLGQFKLGVSNNAAEAWQLPSRTIGSHQYILLYCDKEDTGHHAPYRIDSGKSDGIWLFQNGEIADCVLKLKKQPAPNIAYGRETDGSDKWGYQATPTPGAANCGKLCSDLLGDPVFSKPGQVFKERSSATLLMALSPLLRVPSSVPSLLGVPRWCVPNSFAMVIFHHGLPPIAISSSLLNAR